MITLSDYQSYLLNNGRNISEVRKNQSDLIMNATFTGDTGYKKVYILSPTEGWNYEDAKYSKHATYSILKDAVDYYLQFRPKVHYPIGTYVFIPDDVDNDIGFYEYEPVDPFKDSNFTVDKLWMIVGRDDATQFVRYNIIKCNWNLRWIYKLKGERQILNCWCAIRSANSYTSGVWNADYMTQLDNITGLWLPDTYYIFGDKLYNYNLCDTRYIRHDERFILSNNTIDPHVFRCTKITDLSPQGLIKMTVKQTEFDEKVDNVSLMVCDYYDDDNGEVIIKEPVDNIQDNQTSIIYPAFINEDGELEQGTSILDNIIVNIGKVSYFMAVFREDGIDMDNIETEWRIELISEDDTLTEEDVKHLEGLIYIDVLNNNNVSIKPRKSSQLIGKQFILSVKSKEGNYASSIRLEVR